MFTIQTLQQPLTIQMNHQGTPQITHQIANQTHVSHQPTLIQTQQITQAHQAAINIGAGMVQAAAAVAAAQQSVAQTSNCSPNMLKTKKTKAERTPKKPKKEKPLKLAKPKREKCIKRKAREIIDKQGRGIVFNVYMFLKAMHMRQQCQQPVRFAKTQELTAQACGIGKRTVQRIIKEGRISLETNETPVFESPIRQKHVIKRSAKKLDDMDCFILRRTVHEFYDQKQFPTVRQLLPAVAGKINFEGSCEALRKILKDLGFSYRKSADGHKFLMERADIVAARVQFLRTMHQLRKNDRRPVFYLGECSVDPAYSLSSSTQKVNDDQNDRTNKNKGNKIVVCHIGSAKTGFLHNCKLVFQTKPNKTNLPSTPASSSSSSSSKSSDSPTPITEMNAAVFKNWFLKMLLLLPEPSIIVMDSSSHHSKLLDLVPSAASRKADIVEWLWRYGVPHEIKQTRAELLSLVKMHQPRAKSYELDSIASEKGHSVVRLPPYHNQYNPIEMVWAQVKCEVAERNTSQRINDVEVIVHGVLDNTSRDVWEQSVRHAEQLQETDFKKELFRDQHLESFVVNLQSDSESDAGDEDDDDFIHDDIDIKLL